MDSIELPFLMVLPGFLYGRISIKRINRQVSEQTNRSLRKLSIVLAYYGWENYLKLIELFLVVKNLKIKNVIS